MAAHFLSHFLSLQMSVANGFLSPLSAAISAPLLGGEGEGWVDPVGGR